MAVTPSKSGAANTWDIKLFLKGKGQQIFIDEVFIGSLKEAMSYEKQLRSQVNTENLKENTLS